jgi:hypothetical protein
MTTTIDKIYPPLSELVTFDRLPDGLDFIRDGIEGFFDDIFYDNLYLSTSDRGNAAFYSLDLISPRKLAIEIPGTGINIVLNPDEEASGISTFPVTVFWEWEILAFLDDDFDLNTFSFSPEGFFKLGTRILEISEDAFLELAIRAFVEPQGTAVTRIEQFVSDVNNLYGTNIAVPAASENQYRELIESISDAGIESSYVTIFALYVAGTDLDATRENLNYLFSSFLPDDIEAYISDLLIPKAKATLSLSIGIEFPRNILLPVTEQGQAIPDVNSTFVFPKADFLIDTQAGIGYELEFAGSLQPPLAGIANTGLIIQIESLKIDLSKKTNIIEADLDERPVEFTGVYARAVSVTLPSKWFHEVQGQTSNTLRIGAYNLLVGSGGVSGTILLETVPALNGGQITDYYFGDFSLNYPVNIFKKNETTGTIEEVVLPDNNALLAALNANLAAGYTSAFQFPLSLTTTADEIKTFDNIGDYQKYLSTLTNDNILWKSLGESGFKVGFSKFDIAFKYDKIISSDIQGSLVIPNFKDALGNEAQINVTGHLYEDGDFSLTAAVEAGIAICLGDDGSVFKVIIKSLSIGRDDEKIYLEVTGDLDFSNNQLLNKFLSKPIEIKKLRIYSDGSFEIEGGSIPIPGSVHLNLGPVEVDITNITLGAEKLDSGEYKFIGFDCGVSTGSGGLDLRGDGIKIYFNHDGSDMFLRIAGIGIDLMIPGTASEESAALIVKGYLAIKKDEYTGAVSFKLPKAKIAGGAAMKMKPKVPAFAVDAFVELSAPIPLGPTGLGIFGFRGLFGLRYIADLPPGATSNPDKMFDFYTAKKPNPLNANLPEKGLHLGKIVTPEERADGFKSSGTPISIGAGVSLGTSADAGRAFSMQAFLFLSLPEFFMISGKGNVLSERVSIVSETEPPFFAYMAITSEYVSIGLGAEYKIRPDEGQFLDLNAEAQMAFFFNDASAWYIHFGTKEEPNQAQVLKKIFNLNAYAYLMLSVAGIETGAGIKFDMKKKYGPVSVEVNAYCDIYAMISFRKPQVGGGIACGGNISARVFGVGFNISLGAYLMLTVPEPFLVKGGASICLEVNFRIKKWKKCIDIEFRWELNQNNDLSEIKIIDSVPFPVSAYHIGSKNTYALTYFKTTLPNPSNDTLETIPLDTYIDIQLKKPVNPNSVAAKIGGATNPANNTELVPPKAVEKQVAHRFEIEDINIKVWNGNSNSWQNYHPYQALDPNSYLQNVDPLTLKIGYWQKKGKEYNNLRILADSPFSYADNMAGGFIPEQMGVTAAALFCPAKEIANHCVTWDKSRTYIAGNWHSYKNIGFEVAAFDAEVVPFVNVFNVPLSLKIKNQSRLEILLPEKCLKASLRLSSFAQTLKVSFFDLQDATITQNGIERNQPQYVLVNELILSFVDFLAPVTYEDNTQTIKKIIIEAVRPDDRTIRQLQNTLEDLIRLQLEGNREVERQIRAVRRELKVLQAAICDTRPKEVELREIRQLIEKLEGEKLKLTDEAASLGAEIAIKCKLSGDLKALLDKILKEKCIDAFAECSASFFNDLLQTGLFTGEINSLRELSETNIRDFRTGLNDLKREVEKDFVVIDERCKRLKTEYEKILDEIKVINEKLERLEKLLTTARDERTDKCATYIHEVCYLTQIDSWFNQSIPSQAAVEADYDALNNAVSKVIAPIWRPDEMYAIEIKTREFINSSPVPQTYYFGFKTAGPIGHFPLVYLPKELKKQYGLKPDGTPDAAATSFAKKIEIPENSLKFYLDYNKSYPNPIGNIINQKPLFYNNPNLLIFYSEPFVYHFFNNWSNYNSLGQRFASMKIEVQDPAENLQPATAVPPLLTILPNAILNWEIDKTPPIKKSIDVINNLRNPKIKNVDFNGQTCWQTGGEPIVPASKNTGIKVENLKPSKLYNAVIFSRYSKNGSAFQESQIHSYPFQTSRYADLNEQVNSYHLKDFDINTGQLIVKDAIYKISFDFNSLGIILNQLYDVVSHTDETNNFQPSLIQNYPDAFQRLLFGYLKQDPLLPANNTEVNLLYDENERLFGIWIRNPEPFNDPRIPRENLQTSIKLIVNDQLTAPTIPLFSKDNSEFIILHNSLSQVIDRLNLTFVYLVWNGSAYVQEQTVTTENLIKP